MLSYGAFSGIDLRILTVPFPDAFASMVVSPGLSLPGLLPKMDFRLFLSFPRLEPDGFKVDKPFPIKI